MGEALLTGSALAAFLAGAVAFFAPCCAFVMLVSRLRDARPWGMQHPTQDGHAFMLISADGKVRWHQAYQSMYVQPGQLMHDMRAQVSS